MKNNFSAWKAGAPYYVPLFVIGVVLFGALFQGGLWYLSMPFFAVGLFVLYFFRDPRRVVKASPGEIVSPADGKVVGIEELKSTPYYEGPCQRISIFLSIFNVHVNRAPASGQVGKVQYKPGGFRNAMRADASELNESNAIWVETPFGPMTVRQISGAVARRIVCVLDAGQELVQGQKIGMIKFGSRTELYLPPETEVCVRLNQKVHGGTTIVAKSKEG